jgi:hypothetical protein
MTTYFEELNSMTENDLNILLSMAEKYLIEVFGINLDSLPDSPEVFQNIQENAADGYPLDQVLVYSLEG